MPETLLNIEQVAEQLQVSTRTVRRMMDVDEIKGFRVGKRWRFTQSEVDAYLKRQQAHQWKAEERAAVEASHQAAKEAYLKERGEE